MDGEGETPAKLCCNNDSEQRTKYPLRGILANKFPPPYSYADYRAFCLTELSHDNVDFYQEACIYRAEALKRFNKVNSQIDEDEKESSSNQGSRFLELDKLKNGNLAVDYSSQQNLAHQQQTKQLEEGDRQYLSYILQDISRSYIQPGAPKEINLSQVIRSRLIRYIDDGNNLHPDILLPSMNKAFEMMKTESYPRFLRAILSGQYVSKVAEDSQPQNQNGNSSRNLFHENVEIVFPNKQENELKDNEKRNSKEISNDAAVNDSAQKEKNLNTQKQEVITKTAEMNDCNGVSQTAGKEKTGCCCCIQ
ncbi:regulator of G protein signaling superfamily [Neocallimastix californiae]|uniref:Regulator of G protein signaling superfamily n=1 Tax=Neocallimastix californiae TaxID=1754190 RepID=A0A1Y2D669_9FUNG|nr:regulator of G protein signaling superfamily [Neocallimastix californiae]|eukprot:ORY54788.1 regulator of G protein signaling superfamily [Neocallimastix californiae]